MNVRFFVTVPKSLRSCSISFSGYFLSCCSDGINSIDLCSSSMTLFFDISSVLLSPSDTVFNLIIVFFLSIISILYFFITSISLLYFLVFHLFQDNSSLLVEAIL